MDSFFQNEDTQTIEEKIKSITKKISGGSEDPYLHKNLAKNLIKLPSLRNCELALKSINDYLEIKPDDLDAKIIKCRSLRIISQNDEALSILEQLKENHTDFTHPEIEEEIGRNLISKGDYKTAKAILQQANSSFPNTPRIQRALVSVLELNNDYEDALGLTNILLEKNPHDLISIQNKLYDLMNLDRFEEAIIYGDEIRNNFPQIFYRIAFNIYGITGVWKSFSSICYQYGEKKLVNSNHNLVKLNDNNELIIIRNLNDSAKSLFEKSIKIIEYFFEHNSLNEFNILDKDLNSVKTNQLKCYMKLNDYKSALIVSDEILTHQKSEYVSMLKAISLFHLEKFTDAKKIFDEILNDFPKYRLSSLYRLFCIRKTGTELTFNDELQKFKSKFKIPDKKSLTKDGNKNESINTSSKYSSSDEIFGKHSIYYINKTENKLRDFIFSIIDLEKLKDIKSDIWKKVSDQKGKSDKKIYHFSRNNSGAYLTMGELYQILISDGFKEILKEKGLENITKKMEDLLSHISQIITYRNFLDHSNGLVEDTGDLEHIPKGVLVFNCLQVDSVIDNISVNLTSSNSSNV